MMRHEKTLSTKGKRGVTLMLVMMMVLSLLPTMISAEEAPDYSTEIGQYVEVNSKGEIKSGTGTSEPKQTENSEYATGGYIDYTKSIEATETKNVYDITLNVETNVEIVETSTTFDAVLVLDISGSMDTAEVAPGVTRWDALIETASDFARDFMGDGNRISIVVFGGRANAVWTKTWLEEPENDDDENVKVQFTLCEWTDNLATILGALGKYETAGDVREDLRSEGGDVHIHDLEWGMTNIQAGFRGANDALNNRGTGDAQEIVLFLTDGVANRSYTAFFGSSEEVAGAKGAAEELGKLAASNPDAIVYTISYGVEIADFLSDDNAGIAKSVFAEGADDLADAFEAVHTHITMLSELWEVVDPMSKWVTLKTDFSDDTSPDYNAPVTVTDNTIYWNLRTETPTQEGDVYTYTLTYTVELNTAASGFQYNTFYPTNKETSLSFVFSDADGDIHLADAAEVFFLIPTVKETREEPVTPDPDPEPEPEPKPETYTLTVIQIGVDDKGEETELSRTVTEDYKKGDDYSASPDTHTGWIYSHDGASVNRGAESEGTFGTKNITVYFYYDKVSNPYTLTVIQIGVDGDGKETEIGRTVIENYKKGDDYSVTPDTVSGWTFDYDGSTVNRGADRSGTFDESDLEVYFFYAKTTGGGTTPDPEPEPQELTLYLRKRLIDDEGNEIGTGKSFAARVYDENQNLIERVILTANGETVAIRGLESLNVYAVVEEQSADADFSNFELEGNSYDNEHFFFTYVNATRDGQYSMTITLTNVTTPENVNNIPEGDVPLSEVPEWPDEWDVVIVEEDVPLAIMDDVPQTGDSAYLAIYAGICLISMIGVMALIKDEKRGMHI